MSPLAPLRRRGDHVRANQRTYVLADRRAVVCAHSLFQVLSHCDWHVHRDDHSFNALFCRSGVHRWSTRYQGVAHPSTGKLRLV
jgi:hypothetical protein